MLTKEQTAHLRARAAVAVEDCEHDAKAYDEMNPGFPLPGEVQRKIGAEWVLIDAALAAYERVTALLEAVTPPQGGAILGSSPPFHERLRRALEGE
jgi:hypothetical protein